MIPLAEIERARERIAGAAVRTPLVRLPVDAPAEIWLKLENLQPIGSFKIRGATNAIRAASPEELAGGVVTASAGNMAQGVSWAAREAGVPATIVVPDHAPQTKLDAIERLGGRVVKAPYERWWQAIEESRFDGAEGLFVHPVQDELVMAGNGTIGLELVEDLPDVDTVLIPYGGGGLSTGIASAVKQLRPDVKVFAVEPETAAAVGAALAAGEPAEVEYTPSFVDGAGARKALPAMWPRVQEVLDGSHVATLEETAAAIRLLAERVRVIAEGAGALALAVALAGRAGSGRVACIVSGGNIDLSTLTRILAGETPT
ncbi:MAG TPA: pyridoxal-phosphate dependent enzyme [Gaiellaceae bacterium]|nr:pyridoxal-phosphate dependent enzyme [Gaiellaceae bacterium]